MSNVSEKVSPQGEKDGPHHLPQARVKAIAALTESMPLSPEAVFAYSKGAELFIEDLIKSVHSRYGNNIGYDELAAYIQECDELEFLHDFFPRRMRFEDAQTKSKAHDTLH